MDFKCPFIHIYNMYCVDDTTLVKAYIYCEKDHIHKRGIEANIYTYRF